ncbi:MAG: hypothetical protein KDK97_23020 [Verrucomicrobiales bacterium]|nr:hypothetical protein [Verrucomicrobiales bacterium]MCP5558457.1 hypothetical protein [Verrucomicrobiaceae bacterium]
MSTITNKSQNYPGSYPKGWQRCIVTAVAVISILILVATLVFLLLARNCLNEATVQSCARGLFGFWSVFPPIWFWVEYHVLWRPYNDPEEKAMLDRFKYSQETSAKIWLATVAVLGAFCWAGLDGKVPVADPAKTAAIQKVIDQCRAWEKEMSQSEQGRAIIGETLEAYAERMKTINISECPTNFQEAFIRLAGASKKLAYIIKKYPDKLSIGFHMVTSWLAKKEDAGFTQFTDEAQAILMEFQDRNTDVEALAARYGARLSIE